MLIPKMGLSVPCAPISRVPNTFPLSQIGYYVVQCSVNQRNKPVPKFGISIARNMGPSLTSATFFTGRRSYRALPSSSSSWVACHAKFSGKSSELDIMKEEISLNCFLNSVEIDFGNDIETLRRRKIGMANKGKVPWNKGRKHSAETCERIRRRTKEALRDPKVRKKMSECPRSQSNQTKAKIGSSLRQLWRERLKGKRSGEKLLLSWASGIAEAAKIGGSDQQELDWNSYEKLKSEIAFQQRQWVADKVRAKEMVRLRKQRRAQAKAEKLARLAQKRELQDEQEVKGERKRTTRKKSKEEIEKLAVAQELKLKERLTKIHRKKSSSSQITNQDQRAWERLDLELTKSDRILKEVSLADQIEAVKNKRALTGSSSIYLSSERSVE